LSGLHGLAQFCADISFAAFCRRPIENLFHLEAIIVAEYRENLIELLDCTE